MTSPEKENPQGLELRARPRPVTRLNRKTIAALAGTLALAVMVAVMWGLRKPPPKKAAEPQETHNVDRIARAEGLQSLPRDYASIPKVPQLGAPIGELGRPVLRAEQEAGIPQLPERPTFRQNPEEDAIRTRRLKDQSEAEAAGRAQIIVKLERRSVSSSSASTPVLGSLETGRSDELQVPQARTGAADPNKQAQKQAFIEQDADPRIYASATLQTPRSPFQLMTGSIIPAALISGIKSDLPGPVSATVTENVFDSITGEHLLIPQGSRLIGQYDSDVAFGQRRALVVWTRLIMPNGSSIVLDRLPATDTEGYSGLEDQVDWHWRRILGGAAVSTLLGVGAELAAPEQSGRDGAVVIATRESVQDTVNQLGQEITRRNLDIQPTLTERPGLPLRVIVNRDLVLQPYSS